MTLLVRIEALPVGYSESVQTAGGDLPARAPSWNSGQTLTAREVLREQLWQTGRPRSRRLRKLAAS